MPLATPIYDVYQDKKGNWRVRFIARNGEKWNSAQKYTVKGSAINSAKRQKAASATAVIRIAKTIKKK